MRATLSYRRNSMLLEISGLKDEADKTSSPYLNAATLTVTAYKSDEGLEAADSTDEVDGETWPLTLSYLAASDGVYQATIAETLGKVGSVQPVRGTIYYLLISGTSGSLKLYEKMSIKMEDRFVVCE